MRITVRFFASLRDAIGASQCALEIPEGTRVSQMLDRLVADYPALAGHRASWHVAVNQVYAEPDTMLQSGDRVAIFPYVAGG